jgi:hypothetical protein
MKPTRITIEHHEILDADVQLFVVTEQYERPRFWGLVTERTQRTTHYMLRYGMGWFDADGNQLSPRDGRYQLLAAEAMRRKGEKTLDRYVGLEGVH